MAFMMLVIEIIVKFGISCHINNVVFGWLNFSAEFILFKCVFLFA